MGSIIIDPNTQLRKLNLKHQRTLELILDADDLWKNLMSKIPKTLDRDPDKCNISKYNGAKYNSEHFRIVENVSRKENRSCTNILFDEWGTSGKILPTLSHLLHLLTKAELLRAAEYVAEILGKPLPKRPKSGPAAKVNFDESTLRTQDKFEHVEEISVNSSVLDSKNLPNLPNIHNVQNMEHVQNLSFRPAISQLLASSTNTVSSMDNTNTNSKLSSEENEDLEIIESQLPDFNLLQEPTESALLPDISLLKNDLDTESSNLSSTPDFDLINNDQSTINPSSSDNSLSLPNLSYFQNNTNTNNTNHSNSSSKRLSPLPNLTLNTDLPHFNYNDLLKATNEFNDNPYECKNQQNEGRFLGKGAFGSVYIAFGLLPDENKPVAVKKLNLDLTMDDNSLDTVTKQFSNEVEILCKFRHDNLMALLGFSCDGFTYCLIYEYLQGGSLKDRLQQLRKCKETKDCKGNEENNPQSTGIVKCGKLMWTDRLYISLGISKAVAYLHTAFKDPIIHRDIKSANILLDENNKPKLGDFGLIRNLYNKHTSTFTTPIGTSHYMPQEAFRGEISDKWDSYSFGMVLLELLTGLPVFDESRSTQFLGEFVEEQFELQNPVLDSGAGNWTANKINVGNELLEIAFKCLEDKKSKRMAMVDVSQKLSQILDRIK